MVGSGVSASFCALDICEESPAANGDVNGGAEAGGASSTADVAAWVTVPLGDAATTAAGSGNGAGAAAGTQEGEAGTAKVVASSAAACGCGFSSVSHTGKQQPNDLQREKQHAVAKETASGITATQIAVTDKAKKRVEYSPAARPSSDILFCATKNPATLKAAARAAELAEAIFSHERTGSLTANEKPAHATAKQPPTICKMKPIAMVEKGPA